LDTSTVAMTSLATAIDFMVSAPRTDQARILQL
jgi:hypothetical protein